MLPGPLPNSQAQHVVVEAQARAICLPLVCKLHLGAVMLLLILLRLAADGSQGGRQRGALGSWRRPLLLQRQCMAPA
jgi:hypothetical protein